MYYMRNNGHRFDFDSGSYFRCSFSVITIQRVALSAAPQFAMSQTYC